MSKKQREKVEDEVRYHRAQSLTTPNGLTNTNQISLVNGQLTCTQIGNGQTIINSNTNSSISMSPVSIYLQQPNNQSINNTNSNSNGFEMINTNNQHTNSNNTNSNINSRTTNSTTNGILINGNNQMIIQQPNSSTPTPSNQIADPSPDSSSVFEPQSQQPSSSTITVNPYNGGLVFSLLYKITKLINISFFIFTLISTCSYAYNLNSYENDYYNSVVNFDSLNDYADSTTYDQRLMLNTDGQFNGLGNNNLTNGQFSFTFLSYLFLFAFLESFFKVCQKKRKNL